MYAVFLSRIEPILYLFPALAHYGCNFKPKIQMDYFHKSNWSRQIGLRYLIGLAASLSLTLTAFEWKSFEEQKVIGSCFGDSIESLIDIPNNYSPPSLIITQPEIIETFDEEIAEEILLDLTSEFESEESLKQLLPFYNNGKTIVQKYDTLEDMTCTLIVTESQSKVNLPKSDIESEESSEEQGCILFMEENAEPEGGFEAFYKYLSRNVKIPSQMRLRLGDTKIFVQFVVEEDGSLTNFKMVKGESIEIYAEVVRVLSNAPKWNAGKQRGRPIRQSMVIPISFHIS